MFDGVIFCLPERDFQGRGVGSGDGLGVARCNGTHGSASEGSSCSSDDDSWAGEPTEDHDGLEAYDMWDDQGDLAKETDPIYLDQLIESKIVARVVHPPEEEG